MTKTLRDFIASRRSEIMSTISSLEAELRQLDVAESAINGLDLAGKQDMVTAMPSNEGEKEILLMQFKGGIVSKFTIKDMIKTVLFECRKGGESSEIIEWIKLRFAVDVPRTSMSPQLSRLKASGELILEGNTWRLAEGVELSSHQPANSQNIEEMDMCDSYGADSTSGSGDEL